MAIYYVYKYIPISLQYSSPIELEEQVQERTKQLKTTVRNLRQTTRELKSQNQRLEEFHYMTTHNIRSPLTNLSALIDLMQQSTSAEEKKEILKQMQATSNKLTSTLDDISSVLEVHQTKHIHSDQLDVEEMLQSYRSVYTQNGKDSPIQIDYDLAKWKEIDYPKTYMESILHNLFSNALKYRKPEEPLNIVIRTHFDIRGRKMLLFKDNGKGFDSERFGERVFQFHYSLEKSPGNKGVGLYLIRQQIETMGGEISVQSKEGEGTVFKIIF